MIRLTNTTEQVTVESPTFYDDMSVASFIAFAEELRRALERGLDVTASVKVSKGGAGWRKLIATSGAEVTHRYAEDEADES